ncbi:uroporphyrinogen-III C-methyltransferase [Cytobacillus sp. FSL K6-0129]|uniref:uroporphyrinogen-III C-methyltransferase n=1 Tax=Cytobacillus sp. FSL K6-0129 TaxID=2921421 RepID=UPI0030F63961
MKGYVYLVGAGCGDPELLTLKAIKKIQQADVILYDRLVNQEILSFAREEAQLIYCGKLPHYHTMKQVTINNFLVKYAKKGLAVVRLKGGDPFVFGRGGEEALECVKHRVPFEVIPGITAGIGAASYAGIPVTHRQISQSFAFITGHQAGDSVADQKWHHLAHGVDTLCIYMGVSQLPVIVDHLIKSGKNSDTPIAIVEWGTTLKQRTITGNLKSIVNLAEEEAIINPSMIIIGEVVKLRDELNWYIENGSALQKVHSE